MDNHPKRTELCIECGRVVDPHRHFRWFTGMRMMRFDRANCLLDYRERSVGHDPRMRWPRLPPMIWRGEAVERRDDA